MAANPRMKTGLAAKARSKITTNSNINTTTNPARATMSLVLLLMN
jgi:hypothetical protein